MLIQKYQDRWANDFLKIKNVLEENIPTDGIAIEHIGSTSVKNLAAKPIIDIDIIYTSSNSFELLKTDLEKLGYYHNGDQGIEGREAFKRNDKGENHIVLDFIYHHLYVCQDGSIELQRHLDFRDFLRENEKERMEYETLKYQIAKNANQDRKEYAAQKEVLAREFVESILAKARGK